MTANVIARLPPEDGNEWDCQCARCGSSLSWRDCDHCGGEGVTAPGELYEQDPLWYDEDDTDPCHVCLGEARWPVCLSASQDENDDPEDRTSWCDTHPLPAREKIASGTPEWFVLRAAASPAPATAATGADSGGKET